MMLSRGWQTTVNAGPQKCVSRSIGLMVGSRAPLRPWASWMVAAEKAAKPLTTAGSARSIFVVTWTMGVLRFMGGGQRSVATAAPMAAAASFSVGSAAAKDTRKYGLDP